MSAVGCSGWQFRSHPGKAEGGSADGKKPCGLKATGLMSLKFGLPIATISSRKEGLLEGPWVGGRRHTTDLLAEGDAV